MSSSSKTKTKAKRPWQEIAKEAEDHRRASLAKVIPGLPVAFERIQFSEALPKSSMDVPGKALQPKDFQITQKLPEELIRLMASGELSSVEVTTAFLRRAVLAQKLVSED
jgi:amidase